MRWAQVNVCVLGSFIFPNWQSFVWNYFRMKTVHCPGIHIQCPMPAVFNVRVATPRGSVHSTVRECAMPTDHLCSEISFSRTSYSPDLISYIYRIASVTLETLYCLCVYKVAQLHAHKNKHLLSVHFSEGTLPKWVVNNFWMGRKEIVYAHSCITFGLIDLDGGRWYSGLLQWIRARGTKKVENHCSMPICCFKKTI